MGRTMIVIAFATSASVGWATSLGAQWGGRADSSRAADSVPGALVGRRVRVSVGHATEARFVGRLVSMDDSALVLRSRISDDPVVLALADVRRLEVSEWGPRALGALRGAGIGLAVGVAAGAILGATTFDEGSDCYFVCSREDAALLGAVVIGVPATAVGALVGVLVPGERWVPAEGVRVGLTPGPRNQLTVTARMNF